MYQFLYQTRGVVLTVSFTDWKIEGNLRIFDRTHCIWHHVWVKIRKELSKMGLILSVINRSFSSWKSSGEGVGEENKEEKASWLVDDFKQAKTEYLQGCGLKPAIVHWLYSGWRCRTFVCRTEECRGECNLLLRVHEKDDDNIKDQTWHWRIV